MIKPINKDINILRKESAPATIMDLRIAKDLEDTLRAHQNECVGMAANMIGVLKNIIVFDDNGTYKTMLNPEIISASEKYETMEGCLSIPGQRKTERYYRIKVRYMDTSFKLHEEEYADWTAQIIQHEIDHLNGILI